MELARKILDGLAHCLPESETDRLLSCETCPYVSECNGWSAGTIRLPLELVEDMRRFVKKSLGRTLTM